MLQCYKATIRSVEEKETEITAHFSSSLHLVQNYKCNSIVWWSDQVTGCSIWCSDVRHSFCCSFKIEGRCLQKFAYIIQICLEALRQWIWNQNTNSAVKTTRQDIDRYPAYKIYKHACWVVKAETQEDLEYGLAKDESSKKSNQCWRCFSHHCQPIWTRCFSHHCQAIWTRDWQDWRRQFSVFFSETQNL